MMKKLFIIVMLSTFKLAMLNCNAIENNSDYAIYTMARGNKEFEIHIDDGNRHAEAFMSVRYDGRTWDDEVDYPDISTVYYLGENGEFERRTERTYIGSDGLVYIVEAGIN